MLTWERAALGFILHAVISVTLRGRLTELEISGIRAQALGPVGSKFASGFTSC